MTTTTTLSVAGMTCDHCVKAVRAELVKVAGVDHVDVALDSGTVTLTSVAPLAEQDLRAAIDEAGYEMTS